jgi:hypothetical protein
VSRIEYAGIKRTVECLILADGSCPSGSFLDSLDKKDRRKMDALFAMIGDLGEIRNRERFKRLVGSDGIFAFKSYQIRIPCFFAPDGRVILAFGIIKKSDKWKPTEIQRAEEYRRWFVQQ